MQTTDIKKLLEDHDKNKGKFRQRFWDNSAITDLKTIVKKQNNDGEIDNKFISSWLEKHEKAITDVENGEKKRDFFNKLPGETTKTLYEELKKQYLVAILPEKPLDEVVQQYEKNAPAVVAEVKKETPEASEEEVEENAVTVRLSPIDTDRKYLYSEEDTIGDLRVRIAQDTQVEDAETIRLIWRGRTLENAVSLSSVSGVFLAVSNDPDLPLKFSDAPSPRSGM